MLNKKACILFEYAQGSCIVMLYKVSDVVGDSYWADCGLGGTLLAELPVFGDDDCAVPDVVGALVPALFAVQLTRAVRSTQLVSFASSPAFMESFQSRGRWIKRQLGRLQLRPFVCAAPHRYPFLPSFWTRSGLPSCARLMFCPSLDWNSLG